jgi:hypothetical protein
MSLYKDASLVMIPSAVKDGKLYSIRPTDGSGDFTFSRGSNLAATRVDVNGLIEKGRENYILHSNNFGDATWGKTRSSFVSGQAGYDGSNDAWAFVDNTNNSTHLIVQNITSSQVATFSVYAKAGAVNFLAFRYEDANVDYAYFDLANGTLGTIDSDYIDAKITSVGGGWYRCEASRTSAARVVLLSAQSDNDPTYAGAGNTALYIQDAQLEQGLVATDYIETGASTAQAGILEDLPRLDYSGSCPALLLEPQRSNVVTNSEYVSSSDYVVGNWTGTITSNTNETLSPDGGYNATKFVKAGASDRVYFHNNQPDGAYTGSIYLKAASGSENTTIEISVRRFGGGGGSTSKLVTITNEWQRFDVTATNLTGGTTTAMYVADFSMGGTATEFYSYGMQIEAGSYPTSYIPTYGSAVTRSGELALGGSISLGNSHTIFFNGELNTIDNNKVFMEFITSGATTSATIRNVIGTLRLYNQIDSNYPLGGIQSDNNKWVIRIDGTAYTLFYNYAGSPASQSGSFATARNLDKINLRGAFTENSVKQVLSFPIALTNAECNSLVE